MKSFILKTVAAALVMMAMSNVVNTASAHDHGRSYGGHSHSQGYRYGGNSGYVPRYTPSYPVYHDTTHYDYHPGSFVPHGGHYHYVPGHYDLHRTGHFHNP